MSQHGTSDVRSYNRPYGFIASEPVTRTVPHAAEAKLPAGRIVGTPHVPPPPPLQAGGCVAPWSTSANGQIETVAAEVDASAVISKPVPPHLCKSTLWVPDANADQNDGIHGYRTRAYVKRLERGGGRDLIAKYEAKMASTGGSKTKSNQRAATSTPRQSNQRQRSEACTDRPSTQRQRSAIRTPRPSGHAREETMSLSRTTRHIAAVNHRATEENFGGIAHHEGSNYLDTSSHDLIPPRTDLAFHVAQARSLQAADSIVQAAAAVAKEASLPPRAAVVHTITTPVQRPLRKPCGPEKRAAQGPIPGLKVEGPRDWASQEMQRRNDQREICAMLDAQIASKALKRRWKVAEDSNLRRSIDDECSAWTVEEAETVAQDRAIFTATGVANVLASHARREEQQSARLRARAEDKNTALSLDLGPTEREAHRDEILAKARERQLRDTDRNGVRQRRRGAQRLQKEMDVADERAWATKLLAQEESRRAKRDDILAGQLKVVEGEVPSGSEMAEKVEREMASKRIATQKEKAKARFETVLGHLKRLKQEQKEVNRCNGALRAHREDVNLAGRIEDEQEGVRAARQDATDLKAARGEYAAEYVKNRTYRRELEDQLRERSSRCASAPR